MSCIDLNQPEHLCSLIRVTTVNNDLSHKEIFSEYICHV